MRSLNLLLCKYIMSRDHTHVWRWGGPKTKVGCIFKNYLLISPVTIGLHHKILTIYLYISE